MANLNNPAGRLLRFLEEGKLLQSRGLTAEQVFYQVLLPKDDKGNQTLLLQRLALVFSLPSEIEASVCKIIPTEEQALSLEWLPAVVENFRQYNCRTEWNGYIRRFDEKILYGLRLCDQLLAKEAPEATLEHDDLKRIQQELNVLCDSLLASSDLPAALKNWMLTRLESIDRALKEYQIAGTDPLVTAVQATIGCVAFDAKLYHQTKDTAVGGSFWDWVIRLAAAVALVQGSIQIGKDITLALPSDSEIASPQDVVATQEP